MPSPALRPRAALPAVQRPILPASRCPASRHELDRFRAVMLGTFKIPSGAVVANPATHVAGMAMELGARKFPNVVLLQAYRRALGMEKWLPDTATMVGLCEKILHELKAEERRRREMEIEEQRRREEREQRERSDAKRIAAKSVLEAKRPALALDWDVVVFALTAIFGYVRLDAWLEAVIAEEPWATAAAERFIEIPDPEGLAEAAQSWTPMRIEREWQSLHRPGAADQE